MQMISTRSIWQQRSLVLTPQPVVNSFPCYTNKLYGMKVILTSLKKKKKKKRGGNQHSASVFETLESFETEHYLFLA